MLATFPIYSFYNTLANGDAGLKVAPYLWRVALYPIAPYASMVDLYPAVAVEGCASTVDLYVDIYPSMVAPYP